MLVAIFWDKISEQINDWMSTDMALNIYETSVLDWENWLEDSIDALIENNKWEVKYNFIRVKERLEELKVVFEEEIIPINNKRSLFREMKNFQDLRKNNIEILSNKNKFNELTKRLIQNNLI